MEKIMQDVSVDLQTLIRPTYWKWTTPQGRQNTMFVVLQACVVCHKTVLSEQVMIAAKHERDLHFHGEYV